MAQFNLNWHNAGSLLKPDLNNSVIDSGGVYLWLYNGQPKRIIYVGTADWFRRRIGEHVGQHIYGLGYLFELVDVTDPYLYLIKSGAEYLKLIENRVFYEPQGNKPSKPKPLAPEVAMSFLKNSELWICPVPQENNPEFNEISKYLETQIQYVLKKTYKIGYGEKDRKNCSWLGKMERHCKKDLTDYVFKFEKLPDVDTETQFLINNLSEKIKEINAKQ